MGFSEKKHNFIVTARYSKNSFDMKHCCMVVFCTYLVVPTYVTTCGQSSNANRPFHRNILIFNPFVIEISGMENDIIWSNG